MLYKRQLLRISDRIPVLVSPSGVSAVVDMFQWSPEEVPYFKVMWTDKTFGWVKSGDVGGCIEHVRSYLEDKLPDEEVLKVLSQILLDSGIIGKVLNCSSINKFEF